MSEHILSSLSAYGAIIALIPALVALGATERGGTLLRGASRRARVTVRPSDGTCERRLWPDFPDGSLHSCSSQWPVQCHQRPHVPDSRCWEQTLWIVMNTWNQSVESILEDKPYVLPVADGFVHVDFRVILAFLVMTDDISLDVQTITPRLLVVHSKSTLQRVLTKTYVERMLDGYPPLLKDPTGTIVLKAGDERRGGWVAALGFKQVYQERDVFLPYYYDCVQYVDHKYGDKRGRVFWRSLDRVRRILVEVVAKAFTQDAAAKRDIDIAIKALKWMRQEETESGIEDFFDIPWPNQPLQPQEEAKIVKLFNGSPLIAASKESSFRSEWSSLLHWILIAAVFGSERCIKYFKNPGKELEHHLSMEALRTADVYFRGCG